MRIDLEQIYLETYDKNKVEHKWLVEQFQGESHSDFISLIDSRLQLNNKQKSFPFDTGFIVNLSSDELLGYVFISSIRNDEVFLEYSILEDKRGKGYGKLTLSLVTDYLFQNYNNIRDVVLDIDVSNEASMNTAMSCGYYEDDYQDNQKIIFKNYNLNYMDKRKKRR